MPRLTKEQKLEQAREKADQARAKLRSAAAALAAERRNESRKKDTRRKILAGAYFMYLASKNQSASNSLKGFIGSLEGRDKEAFEGWEIPSPPPKLSAPAPAQAGAFDGGPGSPPSPTVPAPPAPASA